MNMLMSQTTLKSGLLFNKSEGPETPKEGDDLKGAIPKGFEKFYKKKGEEEGKPSSSTNKKDEPEGPAGKTDDKKQREEGQKSDDEEATEAPDRDKATKKGSE